MNPDNAYFCAGELANVFCMIISVPEFSATQEETAEVAQVVLYDSGAWPRIDWNDEENYRATDEQYRLTEKGKHLMDWILILNCTRKRRIMTEEQTLIAFENAPIRRHFDEATETWYFSIVDVIAVLSESVNPRDYWFRMKVRVKSDDGLELSTICR